MLDGFSAPQEATTTTPGVGASPALAPTLNPNSPPGRGLDDPVEVRTAIFDKALHTVQHYKPVASTTHTMFLENPAYEGPSDFTTEQQKHAILNNQSLGRRLRSDVVIRDNASGKELTRRRVTLAQIPYYTDSGTFINNGTAYTMANQIRLKPGAYTREKESGELETHINPTPGNGVPHRLFLDPKSGIFRVRIGQANIPLVPLLQAMGVNKEQLRQAWGTELTDINLHKTTAGDLPKLYQRLVWNATEQDSVKQQEAIRNAMLATKLDPEVTKRTLGQPYDHVSAEMMLTATRKLLAIKNKSNPAYLKRLGLSPMDQDDRDHLAFMHLMGPEDIVAERLRSGATLLRASLWKAVKNKHLDAFPVNILNKAVRSALLDSGLAQASEEINPIQILEQRMRVTRMGVGAIPSADAVPESSRAVQYSHLNFIDPVATPECFDSETYVMTEQGWLKWPKVSDNTKLLCRDSDGTTFYATPIKLIHSRYTGRMLGYTGPTMDYLVTPNHRFFVRQDDASEWEYRTASELPGHAYIFPTGMHGESEVRSAVEPSKHYHGYYAVTYQGMVHCATVPGGMLYCKRNGKELWTGNSSRAGVDVRFSRNVRKGPNGEMWTQFHNPKTRQLEWKQPNDLYDATIAFPGVLPITGNEYPPEVIHKALEANRLFHADGQFFIPAVRHGKMDIVPTTEVDYQVPHMEQAFTPTANLIPLKSGMKGQRAAMAARFTTQALPLVNAEAPWVQSGLPDDPSRSYEDLYGTHAGAIRADKPCRVEDVGSNFIKVKYNDGLVSTIPFHRDRPSNRKTYMDQVPVVQPGQTIPAGGLLVRSNYTDPNGSVALGLNARSAYMAIKGYNYEDAQVVSESLAKRLTSMHMYQHAVDLDKDNDRVGLKSFMSIFPGKYNKAQLNRLDENGVIRVGQTVEYGDPLMLVASQRQGRVGEFSRSKTAGWADRSETWTHHTEGVVTDVSKTDKGIVVAVKTLSPLKVGDKLSPRNGSKGVVSAIIPDDEMPVAADGKPLEWAINPMGVITRSNPAQIAETILGKVAALRGQPYKVQDFEDIDDLVDYAQKEADRYGVQPLETVTDPVTGKQIPNVLVGNSFIMKLHHTAESKGSGRGFGAYTAEGTPSKGGSEGSKTWGMLHLNALLSSGATNAIKDASLVRGQENHDYWAAVMSGRTPPDPPVPFVYKKFVNQLKAVGINPVREGTSTQLMALTQKDIDELTGNRELKNADTINWDDAHMAPIPGGLFDESLHGGAAGNRWSRITLHEPIPSPVMEEPIRRLLGLTKPKFNDIMAGKSPFQGSTGPSAIINALKDYNVDKEFKQAEYQVRYGRKTHRDEAIRKLGYLMGIRKTGIPPAEWVWNAVPVMPPIFRPVNKMQGTGTPLVEDANYLYKDVFENNQNLRDNSKEFSDVGDERLALYNSVKALVGLTDPVPQKLQEQHVKGILKHIIGNSPKTSVVQRRLLGHTADLVGRSTIIPNPDLDLDSVALPEEQAWKVYKPFIIRKLVQSGMSPLRAATTVADKEDVAKDALLNVLKERPIIIDRSPVLHRYSVMAFWPRLTKSHNMELNPSINKGFNADYDGDAMQFHVPSTDGAVNDALEKLMPSKNLFAVATFNVHQLPSQEYLGGLYAASTAKDHKPAQIFETKTDALKAFRKGQLDLGQTIHILDERK